MRRSGFSLVELSIVLVILGLLVGAVMTGQSLIRAAQLRSVPIEFQKYQTAVMSFQDKYRQLPGDMRNATDFWGAADGSTGNTAGCQWANPDNIKTCNGNGNGTIQHVIGSNERNRFWQHLANAGLIEGSYTGVDPSPSGYYGIDPGNNVPASRINGAGWTAADYIYSTANFFPETSHSVNKFYFSGPDSYLRPVLLPEEAWNIDNKIDDGRPPTGKLQTITNHTWSANCATTIDMTAEYKLDITTKSCGLLFIDVF